MFLNNKLKLLVKKYESKNDSNFFLIFIINICLNELTGEIVDRVKKREGRNIKMESRRYERERLSDIQDIYIYYIFKIMAFIFLKKKEIRHVNDYYILKYDDDNNNEENEEEVEVKELYIRYYRRRRHKRMLSSFYKTYQRIFNGREKKIQF